MLLFHLFIFFFPTFGMNHNEHRVSIELHIDENNSNFKCSDDFYESFNICAICACINRNSNWFADLNICACLCSLLHFFLFYWILLLFRFCSIMWFLIDLFCEIIFLNTMCHVWRIFYSTATYLSYLLDWT